MTPPNITQLAQLDQDVCDAADAYELTQYPRSHMQVAPTERMKAWDGLVAAVRARRAALIPPPPEPASVTVEFYLQAHGATAAINSAEFYACGVCGACIVEMHRQDGARTLHTAYHQPVVVSVEPQS